MQLTQKMTDIPASVSVTTASIPVDCAQMNKICFQVTSTGAATVAADIQQSNDGVNWLNTGNTAAITVTGTVLVEDTAFPARYCRLNLVVSSGSLTNVSVVFNGKF